MIKPNLRYKPASFSRNEAEYKMTWEFEVHNQGPEGVQADFIHTKDIRLKDRAILHPQSKNTDDLEIPMPEHVDVLYFEILSGSTNWSNIMMKANGGQTILSRFFSPYHIQNSVLMVYGGMDTKDLTFGIPAHTSIKITAYTNVNKDEWYFPIEFKDQNILKASNELTYAQEIDILGHKPALPGMSVSQIFDDKFEPEKYNLLRIETFQGSNAAPVSVINLMSAQSDDGPFMTQMLRPKKDPAQWQDNFVEFWHQFPKGLKELSVNLPASTTVIYHFMKVDLEGELPMEIIFDRKNNHAHFEMPCEGELTEHTLTFPAVKRGEVGMLYFHLNKTIHELCEMTDKPQFTIEVEDKTNEGGTVKKEYSFPSQIKLSPNEDPINKGFAFYQVFKFTHETKIVVKQKSSVTPKEFVLRKIDFHLCYTEWDHKDPLNKQ